MLHRSQRGMLLQIFIYWMKVGQYLVKKTIHSKLLSKVWRMYRDGFGNTLFFGFCTAHCFIPYLRSFKRNKCCVHGNKIKRWKKERTVSKRCSLSSIWIKTCEWDLYKTTRKLFNLGTGYPVIFLMYQVELNKVETIICCA